MQKIFDDTFIVFNADILSDIDISDMIKWHKEKVLCYHCNNTGEDPSAYGVIEYDDKDLLLLLKRNQTS